MQAPPRMLGHPAHEDREVADKEGKEPARMKTEWRPVHVGLAPRHKQECYGLEEQSADLDQLQLLEESRKCVLAYDF
jgi:hypothetical protein